MASSNDNVSMALFCDFENVALGVRDANYEKFDIKPVLERLLLKGSIVVKKAYCDWDRYKGFKAPMHEANFELIEIPHVRQSGKNSADIRMVVDALDLCYTKAHVNTFVIISGDSDFSPLVSKLRENNKKVIGVGVKQSTSDLLVANCDEFIFYDDLVRESRRAAAKRDTREGQPAVKRTPEEERGRREEMDKRRREAVDMAVETFDALVSERGDSGKIWASVLKEAIKRRKPDFSESYYGFRTFGNLLEEAKARGLLEFGRDEKSGAYVYRNSGAGTGEQGGEGNAPGAAPLAQEQQAEGRHEGRRGRGRGRNRGGERHVASEPVSEAVSAELQLAQDENAYAEAEAVHAAEDAEQTLTSASHDAEADLDEEEAAIDAAAAAAAEALAAAADPVRRKTPKLPARHAKAAAKRKNAQAAAAADVWGQGKAAPADAPVQAEPAPVEAQAPVVPAADLAAGDVPAVKPAAKGRARTPAKGRGKAGESRIAAAAANAVAATEAPVQPDVAVAVAAPLAQDAQDAPATPAARSPRPPRPPRQQKPAKAAQEDALATAVPAATGAVAPDAPEQAKPARKPAARGPRRPRKPDAKQD